jgi:hypothetical protein
MMNRSDFPKLWEAENPNAQPWLSHFGGRGGPLVGAGRALCASAKLPVALSSVRGNAVCALTSGSGDGRGQDASVAE